MGSLDAEHDSVGTEKPDILVPVTSDKTRILAPDNDGAIYGVLYEVGLYLVRVGLFQLFLEHNAVAVGYKIAVDSEDTISFHLGRVPDAITYSFAKPCPDSATRVSTHNGQGGGVTFRAATDGLRGRALHL